MFSDESKFYLHSSDGNEKVGCRPSDRFKQENLKGLKKFGGGNVMVWGVIISEGVGKLIRIKNTIDSIGYCNILRDGLIASIKMYNLSLNSAIFQQDNATCHVSRSTLN